jgi:hypothetical protein
MKNYKIYVHDALSSTEAVKDGWSWPAFFFPWIWAFVKGLNGLGAGLLAWLFFSGFLGYFGELNDAEGLATLMWLITIGIRFWLGTEGNNKRGEMLITKGYSFQTTLLASNPKVAIINFRQQGGEAQNKARGSNPAGFSRPTSTSASNQSSTMSSLGSGYKKGNLYKKGD